MNLRADEHQPETEGEKPPEKKDRQMIFVSVSRRLERTGSRCVLCKFDGSSMSTSTVFGTLSFPRFDLVGTQAASQHQPILNDIELSSAQS